MTEDQTYRVRFRFRLGKKLTIKEHERLLKIAHRDVVLSPQLPDVPIDQSEWLIMNAKGFGSESDARSFGHQLRCALELSSVTARIGVDAGLDQPTSGLGQSVKEQILKDTGVTIRSNVHGVDVFPDSPDVGFMHFEATGTLTQDPDPFLADLSMFLNEAENATALTKDIILILNYALMRPEPVAQIVFAVSAVEMLGQQEQWSADQKRLLSRLATEAENASEGTADERREVAAAIKRGMQKIGLRQGVLRLLDRLRLGHLKKTWDSIYGERSTLVHGLAPKPGERYDELAYRTVSLCGQILLAAVAHDIAGVNSNADKFYPVS